MLRHPVLAGDIFLLSTFSRKSALVHAPLSLALILSYERTLSRSSPSLALALLFLSLSLVLSFPLSFSLGLSFTLPLSLPLSLARRFLAVDIVLQFCSRIFWHTSLSLSLSYQKLQVFYEKTISDFCEFLVLKLQNSAVQISLRCFQNGCANGLFVLFFYGSLIL